MSKPATAKDKARQQAQKYICQNRRALHQYSIDSRLEAGLVLCGSEVKALRLGKAHLNDAYVQISHGEAFLIGAHIGEYAQATHYAHTQERTRKLLLHHKQIVQLMRQVQEQGATAVALSMYFNDDGRAKLEVGIGRGKKTFDKREDLKSKQANREISRALRQRQKPA